MHRVWVGVDSVDPVEKLTRHHVRFLQKVDFGLPSCEIFISSALGSWGLSDFWNDTTHKNLVYLRAVALCQDLGIQDLAPVSHKCTVSGLGSIRAIPSDNKHGIM